MIVAIRIAGQINIPNSMQEGLFRLRLRRKYTATLLHPTPENMKLLKSLRNYLAYGDIDKETLHELIKRRSQPLKKGQKLSPESIISELEKKGISNLSIKPFFRLHPPRGGIDAKKHFGVGKGVLGDNKENINNLIRRML